MSTITLEPDTLSQVLAPLDDDSWVIACLCAGWCDVCRNYRPHFDALAARHPKQQFLWIDIEDQADIVGDIDVENFPSLLIQRGDIVAFFGTVEPEPRLAERLLQAQMDKSDAELRAESVSSAERRRWQQHYNLRSRLRAASANND